MAHGTLMGSQQPPFQQGNYAMDARQQVFSLGLMSLHLPVMHVAPQGPVSVQPVRSYRAARFDDFVNKTVQHLSARRVDPPHPNATDARPILFCRNDNQGLFFGFSADYAFFLATPERLVDFHRALQAITARPDHRAPEFVQQRPGGLVAAQPQQSLDRQGTASVLLARDIPHGSKPKHQRQMAILKNRASRDGRLMSAIAAHPATTTRPPRGLSATFRTNKTGRPTEGEQVIPARPVGVKTTLKLHQRFRIILPHARTLYIGGGGVK